MRIRGPINIAVFGDKVWVEGEPVLVRYHRRYVTVWSLWRDSKWQGTEKVPHVELHVYHVPWDKVDYTFQVIGGENE